jgi:hypothetical protein
MTSGTVWVLSLLTKNQLATPEVHFDILGYFAVFSFKQIRVLYEKQTP